MHGKISKANNSCGYFDARVKEVLNAHLLCPFFSALQMMASHVVSLLKEPSFTAIQFAVLEIDSRNLNISFNEK